MHRMFVECTTNVWMAPTFRREGQGQNEESTGVKSVADSGEALYTGNTPPRFPESKGTTATSANPYAFNKYRPHAFAVEKG